MGENYGDFNKRFSLLNKTEKPYSQRRKEKYHWQVALIVLVLFIFSSLINIPFSREVKRLNIEAGNTGINLNESIYADITYKNQ